MIWSFQWNLSDRSEDLPERKPRPNSQILLVVPSLHIILKRKIDDFAALCNERAPEMFGNARRSYELKAQWANSFQRTHSPIIATRWELGIASYVYINTTALPVVRNGATSEPFQTVFAAAFFEMRNGEEAHR
jgi:hypothetical protein